MFKKLLEDANNKIFNCLICYRLDRVSRNVLDFSNTIEYLNKLNISFISVKEQFDTSTPMGRAMLYIASVFAQLERETIAERVKDNMYELAKYRRWLGGRIPYGFKSSSLTFYDEKMTQHKMYQLEIDDENLNIVKYIFDEYLKLKSLTKLHKLLFNNEIKGPYNGNYTHSTLSSLLRNPVYVKADNKVFDVVGIPDNNHGILTYAKNTEKPIAEIAMHSVIISAKDWLEVQSILDKNAEKAPRTGTGKSTLLSGLLKCSICGSNMRTTHKYSTNKTISYYVCGKKRPMGHLLVISKILEQT